MKQWHLWWPLKMAGFGPLLWQCPQLEQYPQLELKALMMQEGEAVYSNKYRTRMDGFVSITSSSSRVETDHFVFAQKMNMDKEI